MGRQTARKRILNTGMLLLVAMILFFVFRRDYRAIFESMRGISLLGFLILLGMGMGYQLLDAAVFFTVLHGRLPSLSYHQAVVLTFLTVFGNTTTSGAGSVPLQSYYLYCRGLPAGSGIGLMMLEYIFHKATMFLYAAVVVATQSDWLQQEIPSLMKYIYPGFAICGVIIGALVLLCTWKRVRQLLAWLIGKLPDYGAWVWRKEEWTRNLEMLYQESAALLRDRCRCGRVFFLNFLKLSWLYMIPFISMRILGVEVLKVSQAVALSAVMLLITGALPNVAGIGPLEFAFLLLFGAAAGRVEASSALILYRVATYFFPFLLSIGVFFQVKKDWEAKSGKQKR